MALLYRATLAPSKLRLVATWAPKQPWFVGDENVALESVASFRFDDPDGEVGYGDAPGPGGWRSAHADPADLSQ